MLIIQISGDRNWGDTALIRDALVDVKGEFDQRRNLLVHGKCRGADHRAGMIAESLGYELIEVPAMWNLYKKPAGQIRNGLMLSVSQALAAQFMSPLLVMAFHDNIRESTGTKGLLRQALDKNIECRIYSHEQPNGKEYKLDL